jgi:hypothetical protein
MTKLWELAAVPARAYTLRRIQRAAPPSASATATRPIVPKGRELPPLALATRESWLAEGVTLFRSMPPATLAGVGDAVGALAVTCTADIAVAVGAPATVVPRAPATGAAVPAAATAGRVAVAPTSVGKGVRLGAAAAVDPGGTCGWAGAATGAGG